MTIDLSRRELVGALAAAALLPGISPAQAAAAGLAMGPATPFSWEWLKGQALALSQRPYKPPVVNTKVIHAIDYDAAGQIGYREDRTLWADKHDETAIRFFHLSRAATTPVTIAVVENGQARQISYSESLFTMPAGHIARKLGSSGGFAGFRAMNANGMGDWLAFLGASYFRSAGALNQYGLSARGIAVNTATAGLEEFPAFTGFWLEHRSADEFTAYALLDGPSVAGAYRIVNRKTAEGVEQDVTLFVRLRADVERLGFAPLTSMYWYGEAEKLKGIDWRPEIHDSDGLLMWSGSGERIWRPLGNPPRVMANSFADDGPRGFGLLQRDRQFDHYQDDGVFYQKRPSLWIEPQGNWGKGSVQLVEIPTVQETDDNIVAFWVPAAPALASSSYDLAYHMRWIATEPAAGPVARVINTWRGVGGRPGLPPPPGVSKLVIDFQGERLKGLTRDSGVEPVVSVNGATASHVDAYPVVGFDDRWRLTIDVKAGSTPPTDLRAFLRLKGDALTETWLYQLF